MKVIKQLVFALLLLCSVSALAQSETVDKKELREARRQERKEKRQEKKASKQEISMEQVEAAAVENQETVQSVESVEVVEVQSEAQEVQETQEVEALEPVKSEVQKPETTKVQAEKTTGSDVAPNLAASSDDASDENTTTIIWLILIVVFIGWVLVKLFSTRCPNCKKFFAMRVVNEEYYGRSKSKREKDSSGKEYTQYYHNYKVTKACKHCGTQRYHIEERKA